MPAAPQQQAQWTQPPDAVYRSQWLQSATHRAEVRALAGESGSSYVCEECRAVWIVFAPPMPFATQCWHAGNQIEVWPRTLDGGCCATCSVVWRYSPSLAE